MITYPRERLLQLCRDLGHDPAMVSSILIEPGHITVTHVVPLEGGEPGEGLDEIEVVG